MADGQKKALEMLSRFEREPELLPLEAERLLIEIFSACGHTVVSQGFIGGDEGVDCYLDTDLEGRRQRIGVEVKFQRQPAGVASVEQALYLKQSGQFSRVMVVSRSGFSSAAIERAETEGLGEVDLFGPDDLRNWLSKHDATNPTETQSVAVIIRGAMEALAKSVAERPEQLPAIEWRDLERLLSVAFEGLGFETRLTRSGKDGGFDLELVSTQHGKKDVYLVEVKHWTNQKPGPSHLNKLVRVTASKKATGSLLLSTSGFTSTVYSGLAELTAPVRLGDGGKIISICRAYYRLQSGLWAGSHSLRDTLYGGTVALGEHL